MLSNTSKLAKKNDTQPKRVGEEMLPHFPQKPHFNNMNSKYTLCPNLN
jgi:hypothetical protein